jgi:hypothetical protein
MLLTSMPVTRAGTDARESAALYSGRRSHTLTFFDDYTGVSVIHSAYKSIRTDFF